MSLQICKKELPKGKEHVICTTTEDTMESDLMKRLEVMEDAGYIQCEATDEESQQWNSEFKDWIVVCDAEFGDDRTLIYVK